MEEIAIAEIEGNQFQNRGTVQKSSQIFQIDKRHSEETDSKPENNRRVPEKSVISRMPYFFTLLK